MEVVFRCRFEAPEVHTLLNAAGLAPGGLAQQVVDSEVIRYCDPKVPFRTGALKDSALSNTVIGSGEIVYAAPYAHYLYMGEVYGPNFPIFEAGQMAGWRSPRGKLKYPTGRPLTYAGAPERGAHWAERMDAEHHDDIVRAAAAAIGGHT